MKKLFTEIPDLEKLIKNGPEKKNECMVKERKREKYKKNNNKLGGNKRYDQKKEYTEENESKTRD